MRIEKYHAEDMQEAFRLIKAELGPDAVVIQSRKIRLGGMFGLFRRPVYEVLAAIDEEVKPQKFASTIATARPGARAAYAAGAKLPSLTDTVAPASSAPASTAPASTAPASTAPATASHPRPAAPKPGSVEPAPAASVAPVAKPEADVAKPALAEEALKLESSDSALLREMKSNMVELKTALSRLSKQAQFGNIANFAPVLVNLYQRLVDQELSEDLAQDIVLRVNGELGVNGAENYELVREYVRKHLQELITVTGPPKLSSGRCKSIFLIGPTGVGKTTTLAKLAANYCLVEHKKVALVTVDTFRVAAIPQLRTYADIIGVPLEVVYTPAELTEALGRCGEKDLVLIDTPGGSPRNSNQLELLKEYVDGAETKEVYLAVASPTKYRDMLEVYQRFSITRIDGLLFTKIDETSRYGPLVNLLNQTKTRLTYLTTGQNVPSDIELADSVKMADLLLAEPEP